MLVLAWIVAMGLLTLFFQRWLDVQHNPNREVASQMTPDGVREVVLQRNREGHYVANGRINGQEVEFLLDTGATMVAIPGKIARRLQLERGPGMYASTANGTVLSYATFLDQVELGPIRIEGVEAGILPSIKGDTILLGMSFLKQLEFTQRGDTLIIRQ